jgi:iron complex outermembrane receptor protein
MARYLDLLAKASPMAIVASIMLAPAGAALAQTPTAPAAADEEPVGLAEVIVTANRRSENLQDVGISVTAVNRQEMQDLGFTNSTDIIKQIPSLSMLSSSASNTNVNVRGISQNDFADHLEGPIAVYADDGYLGAAGALNGQIYDLERVEVLRGPQGTLFGRNATGGLIHYVSRGPTQAFEGYGRIDIGERELVEFESAVGGALASGVRARLSVAGTHSNGFVKNLIGPVAGNKNNISGRLQVEFDLGEKTELRLMVNGNTNAKERGQPGQGIAIVADQNGQGRALGPNEIGTWPNIIAGGVVTGACGGCDITGYRQPDDPFVRRLSDTGKFKKDLAHAQAKLTSDLGFANLTTVTDHLYLKKALLDIDVDAGPSQLFRYNTFQEYNQFSQEIRFDGTVGALKWQAGAYYLNIRGDYETSVVFDVSTYVGAPICGVTPGFSCPTPIPGVVGTNLAGYSVDVDSYSGFAQLEYEVSPQLSLIGGLRYTHDEKTADFVWTTTAIPFPTPTRYNPSTDPTAGRTFENLSLKAEVDWRPAEDTLVFASFSRGYKGGNWALPVFPPPITSAMFPLFPHKQERLDDYEIGMKTQFLDRRVRLNVGAFYYDYSNYQAFSLAGLAQSIFNKDAKAWGGEAELRIAPTRGLDISLAASSLTSRVYKMQYPNGQFFTAELPLAAKLSVNGFVRYAWDVLDGSMAATVSFTSMGAHYFDVANEPLTREGRNFTADARLGYTSSAGWDVAVWVRNLNDEKYRTFALDIGTLSLGNQTFAAPRTFGVSLGHKF